MLPTEKEIKILALKNILTQRKAYDTEIEERGAQLKELESQQNEKHYDAQSYDSLKKVYQEVETLRKLCDEKVREIAADVRENVSDETDISVQHLLLEAARYD